MELGLIIFGAVILLLIIAAFSGTGESIEEKLCTRLREIGIDARLTEGRLPGVSNSALSPQKIIQIEKSPICSVYVTTEDYGDSSSDYDHYEIPDKRQLPRLILTPVRKAKFPAFWSRVEVNWQVTAGGDQAREVAATLARDQDLKKTILDHTDNLTISTSPERRCWEIGGRQVDLNHEETRWALYEKVAAKLLVTPLTGD
jgi:hypothetical protein